MKLSCLTQSKPQTTKLFLPGWFRPVVKVSTVMALVGNFTQPTLANPSITSDGGTFENVSCMRFTDISAVEDDSEGDAFQIQFEVLNWTDRPVNEIKIALTQASDVDFLSAGVNSNPVDIPGNLNAFNNWNVTQETNTRIRWNAGISPIGIPSVTYGLIPNIDLIENPIDNPDNPDNPDDGGIFDPLGLSGNSESFDISSSVTCGSSLNSDPGDPSYSA